MDELSFEGTPVYVDQDKPLRPGVSPMTQAIEKGVDLRNFVFHGDHRGDPFRSRAEIGDVQVSETPYTVQGLLRRGVKLNVGYKTAELSFFSVKSPAIYGVRHGLGIEFDSDDHIIGGSAALSLPALRTDVKATYLTGEDQSSLSYGISGTDGKRKGDVASLCLSSRLIPDKLVSDFEIARSRFTPDDSAGLDETSDTAWRLGLSGTVDKYTYTVKYEYIGGDYESIALQGMTKDREGVYFAGSAMLPNHSLSLSASSYRDNVDDNSALPRSVNYLLALDYNYTRFTTLPMGLSLQHNIVETTREPPGFVPIKAVTDTVAGKIAYTQPKWNAGASASFSLTDDRASADLDTSSRNYSLTFSLIPIETLSLSLSPTLIQQLNEATDVRTDTYTANLDVHSQLVKNILFFDVGCSYSQSEASNNSVDTENSSVGGRLALSLRRFFPEYVNPTIALKGNYQKTRDRHLDTETETSSLFLVVELQAKVGL